MSTSVATLPSIPSVRFIGRSGSGKTTLASALVNLWSGVGLRVGAIKHASKAFQMDHEGKDSHRFRANGAASIAVASPTEFAVISQTETPATLADLLAQMPDDLDIVLIEGFKGDGGLAIEVHRGSQPLLAIERSLPGLVAVATDHPKRHKIDVPKFDLSQIDRIAGFIEGRVGLVHPGQAQRQNG